MQKDTKNNGLEFLAKEFIKWAKTEKIVPVNLTTKYRKESHSNQLNLFVSLLTEGAVGFYSFPRKKKWKNPEDAFYYDQKTNEKKRKMPWDNNTWVYFGSIANTDYLKKIWKDTNDSYICVNPMGEKKNKRGQLQRNKENCIGINEMHFDIDILHNLLPYKAQLADEVIAYVISIMYSIFPNPTLITLTGRGFAWYYKYQAPIATYNFDKTETAECELHTSLYKHALKKLKDTFAPWKGVIDIDNVSDFARVTRLPGTINLKANRYAELYVYNSQTKYILKDLSEKLEFKRIERSNQPSRKNTTNKKSCQSAENNRNLFDIAKEGNAIIPAIPGIKKYAESRLKIIPKITLDKHMIDGSGRHKLIFAAYSLARYVYTVKEAINYVENINNTFVEPLSISELYEQVSRVQKHCEKNGSKNWATTDRMHGDGTYLFSEVTLVNDFLPITQEEAISYGMLKTYLRDQKYSANQLNSLKRDERIVELWLCQKMSSPKIAEQLKKEGYAYCSEKTVRNRLKKLNLDASRTQKLEDVTIELRYKKEKTDGKSSVKVGDKEEGQKETGCLICEEKIKKIIELLNGKENLWLTGGAGAGKSTWLHYYMEYLDMVNIKYMILASYGIAAENVHGKTICSGLRIDSNKIWDESDPITYKDIEPLLKINVLIFDEIGVVRPDIYTRIWNLICYVKKNYEHNIRIIVAGDLLQLEAFYTKEETALHKTNTFINNKIWETDAWKTSIEKVLYLTGSKRSENEEYINILNNIAIGKNLKQCVSYINTNVEIRNFAKLLYEQTGAVYLTAYRNEVDAINEYHVAQHKLTDSTYTELEYKENNFQNNTSANAKYPVKLNLPVYIGMPVMTILNSEGLYANGTRGIITKIKKNSITIKDINGKVINIHRKKIYALNNEEAYIYQFPIVPAYAMTIHKAQGLTLNRIILNPKTFVTGQAYVALSRVRCLKNIILTRKLREDDILIDDSTVKYILQTKADYSITL